MATNIIHLTCQHCGAALEIDSDNLIAYCPHCGQKLLFDVDQIGSILLEKEKTKQQEMKYSHDLTVKNMRKNILKGFDKWYWRNIRYCIYFVLGCIALIFILMTLDKLLHITGG